MPEHLREHREKLCKGHVGKDSHQDCHIAKKGNCRTNKTNLRALAYTNPIEQS